MSFRNRLLSTTFLPLVVGVGVGLSVAGCTNAQGGKSSSPQMAAACGANPCAAKKPCGACNPCNPCAAKACNPCNPCAAKACNPCNPCAAKKACNPCNPCAAKKACNPCNPCAAKNPCNPCGASACNPCAAAAGGGTACVVPRLLKASACNPCAAKKACNPCNPCNPCAAKKACNPCNPCAAKNPCNPCNPCAAKNPCNPCNPCAAKNPCNPCAAAAAVELNDAEAKAAYNCAKSAMKSGYSKSGLTSATGLDIAGSYQAWQRYSTRAYVSDTHGGRYVQNYANTIARNYGKFEKAGRMPVGSVLAKDSFVVRGGKVSLGPLFVMEKMPAGFDDEYGNWRYSMVMPTGKVVGTTNGKGSKNVEFCAGCHGLMADTQDSLWFLPKEYRVKF